MYQVRVRLDSRATDFETLRIEKSVNICFQNLEIVIFFMIALRLRKKWIVFLCKFRKRPEKNEPTFDTIIQNSV